jgi:ribonuclease T1
MRGGIAKLALTGLLLLGCWSSVQARQGAAKEPVASIALSSLPAQGLETYQRIHQGGPFPYEKDGVVFGNRERSLPAQKRGYYREYTVRTPGARNRGARRIVCGGSATTPDACFYTADHYASFRKIVP